MDKKEAELRSAYIVSFISVLKKFDDWNNESGCFDKDDDSYREICDILMKSFNLGMEVINNSWLEWVDSQEKKLLEQARVVTKYTQ